MPFTDNFTDADGVDLASHTPSGGTAWTRVTGSSGDMQIKSNALKFAVVSVAVYISDDVGSPNHYVQAKLTSNGNNLWINTYLAARLVDANNFIGYVQTSSGQSEFGKMVAGTWTALESFASSVGSVMGISCNGTTVQFFVDGVQQGTDHTITDFATETSTGFVSSDSRTADHFDDFEAGAVGGGAVAGTIGQVAETGTVHSLTPSLGAEVSATIGQVTEAGTVNQVAPSLDPDVSATIGAVSETSLIQALTPSTGGGVSATIGQVIEAGSVNQIAPSLDPDVSATIGAVIESGLIQALTPSLGSDVSAAIGQVIGTGVVRPLMPTIEPDVSAQIGQVIEVATINAIVPGADQIPLLFDFISVRPLYDGNVDADALLDSALTADPLLKGSFKNVT